VRVGSAIPCSNLTFRVACFTLVHGRWQVRRCVERAFHSVASQVSARWLSQIWNVKQAAVLLSQTVRRRRKLSIPHAPQSPTLAAHYISCYGGHGLPPHWEDVPCRRRRRRPQRRNDPCHLQPQLPGPHVSWARCSCPGETVDGSLSTNLKGHSSRRRWALTTSTLVRDRTR
jgi:hypothetical protein